jgi:hypothetical protein
MISMAIVFSVIVMYTSGFPEGGRERKG